MTTETTKTPAEMLLESGLLEQKCDGFMCREGTVWVERDRTPTATKCLACTGTGLRYWRLRRECPCPVLVDLFSNHGLSYFEYGHQGGCRPCLSGINHDVEECLCQGRGFVPVSEDTALRVLLEWALRRYEVLFIPMGEHIECQLVTHQPFIWQGSRQEGATPLEALADAIKASVEVNT